jgi:Ca-activated chloride channel family protein
MDEQNRDLAPGLTIDELVREVDLPIRTVRYYIAEGLLPGPGARGKAASYGEEHVLRLRMIRLLSERHLPLSDIRQRLQSLTIDELRAVLREEQGRSAHLARLEKARSPKDYISGLLREARASRAPRIADDLAADRPPLASGVYPRRQAPGQSERSPQRPEAWQHWELAPGVELHVRDDVRTRYRALIERLRREVAEFIDR